MSIIGQEGRVVCPAFQGRRLGELQLAGDKRCPKARKPNNKELAEQVGLQALNCECLKPRTSSNEECWSTWLAMASLMRFGACVRGMAVQATVKVAQDTSKMVFPAVSAAGHHQDMIFAVRSIVDGYKDANCAVTLSAEEKAKAYDMLDQARRQLSGTAVTEDDLRSEIKFKDEYKMSELPLFK